jgi:hypothetical protein
VRVPGLVKIIDDNRGLSLIAVPVSGPAQRRFTVD